MNDISPNRWADLRPRLISAAVMLAAGGAAVWAGGALFLALIMALCGAMIWELARLANPARPRLALGFGAAAAGIMLLAAWPDLPIGAAVAALIIAFVVALRGQTAAMTVAVALAALAILACGFGLFYIREFHGIAPILWLLGVVIASDVAGYFAGRMLGGPKFWPSISPKKTWSGTVAGWICAAALGGAVYALGHGSAALIVISPVIAFAGQMGDIGESWLKRRAGIKDSSNLIPGHGGVMDRFDAVVAAAVAVILLDFMTPFWA